MRNWRNSSCLVRRTRKVPLSLLNARRIAAARLFVLPIETIDYRRHVVRDGGGEFGWQAHVNKSICCRSFFARAGVYPRRFQFPPNRREKTKCRLRGGQFAKNL